VNTMSSKNGQNGSITAATYRRLLLLYIIGLLKDGIFGRKRIQKNVYFVSKKLTKKPFEYKHWTYGQYSEDVDEVVMELIASQLIFRQPLDSGASGHKYTLRYKDSLKYYQSFLDGILGSERQEIDKTLNEIGYLPDKELLTRAYIDLAENQSGFGDILFRANLSDKIPVPGINEEDCEELELSLNPRFVGAMSELAKGIETGKIGTSQWKEIA